MYCLFIIKIQKGIYPRILDLKRKIGTYPCYTNIGNYNKAIFIDNSKVYSNIPGGSNWYQANDSISGYLTLTHFDTVNNFIAGTFNFDVQNNKGEILHFTEGRFDIEEIK